METVETLHGILQNAQSDTPDGAVDAAIGVYLAAQSAIDAYEQTKSAAKQLISQVLAVTGATRYSTRAGVVQVTAPSVVVTYVGKSIDLLCSYDADLAMRLYPYRKETVRAGGLRITAKG